MTEYTANLALAKRAEREQDLRQYYGIGHKRPAPTLSQRIARFVRAVLTGK